MNDPKPRAGADEVHSLLAVIADPVTHKARLAELLAQEKATAERIAAHDELMAKTRGLNSAAEAATIVANNRKAALDAREAEIRARENQLAANIAQHNEAKKQLGAEIRQREAAALLKENSVIERENALSEREQTAKREADRLSALKTGYEAKIKKLRELVA
jgi:predicted  nucleic acid-binding Zn-ribbon protein